MAEGGPQLPGGIGLSRLRVYDTPAPDGLVGGSSHVHLASSEGYAVVAGAGAVQTLGPSGLVEVPLEPGAVVWFSPGIVHRLVSDGGLEIMVVMQNAGLPEAGDAVLTVPDAILDDPDAYAAAVALPEEGGADAADAARRRRDLSIEGLSLLRSRIEEDGHDALRRFYERAVALVRHRVPDWAERWQHGPRRQSEEVGRRLRLVGEGRVDHLMEATVHRLDVPTVEERLGMCGRLDVYDPARAR